jgi:hypothetical protein
VVTQKVCRVTDMSHYYRSLDIFYRRIALQEVSWLVGAKQRAPCSAAKSLK